MSRDYAPDNLHAGQQAMADPGLAHVVDALRVARRIGKTTLTAPTNTIEV